MTEAQATLMLNSLSNISASIERIADVLENARQAGNPTPAPVVIDPTEYEPVDIKPGPTKRARKAKTESVVEEKPATDMFATGGVEGPAYTDLDVRGFAKAALDKVGWEKVENVVKKYSKTGQLKNVKAEDYDKIVAELRVLVK